MGRDNGLCSRLSRSLAHHILYNIQGPKELVYSCLWHSAVLWRYLDQHIIAHEDFELKTGTTWT